MLNREASGATAACAAIRRDVFEDVGGLSEELSGNFNDIDLSLKMTRAGYRIVWISHSALFHLSRAHASGPCINGKSTRSCGGGGRLTASGMFRIPEHDRYVRSLFRCCLAARAGAVTRQLTDPWISPSHAR